MISREWVAGQTDELDLGLGPAACLECLRRAWLLSELAPYIEKIATRDAGSRVQELMRLSDADLCFCAAPKRASALLETAALIPGHSFETAMLESACWSVCRHHPAYPSGLRDLGDAPSALFCIGEPCRLALLEPDRTVAIVGARRATTYGRGVATQLGRDLARVGLSVVSGMAHGIDASAHRGAIESGFTCAVLGCGPDVAYPATNRGLHRRIREQGLVISELPPGTTPWRWTFPARNRIMAGLASMTVVVEAAIRSGSLITTTMAADCGRDVGAVPGPVNSETSGGSNALISSGACLITCAQDVLDAMVGVGETALRASGSPLDPDLMEALGGFERSDGSFDSFARGAGLDASQATIALTRLELLGYLECSVLGTWTRTALMAP